MRVAGSNSGASFPLPGKVWPPSALKLNDSALSVVSLGLTLTATEAMERLPGYFGSVLDAACVIVDEPPDTPVTVKVCGMFQLVAVNVYEAGATVAYAGVPLVAPTVTFAVGCESSTTV